MLQHFNKIARPKAIFIENRGKLMVLIIMSVLILTLVKY